MRSSLTLMGQGAPDGALSIPQPTSKVGGLDWTGAVAPVDLKPQQLRATRSQVADPIWMQKQPRSDCHRVRSRTVLDYRGLTRTT